MPLAVTLSLFGPANVSFFSGSRVSYVAAREGHLVRHGVCTRQGEGGSRRIQSTELGKVRGQQENTEFKTLAF